MTGDTSASDPNKTKKLTGSDEGGTDMTPGGGAGEDEGSVPTEGGDEDVRDDQKPTSN